MDIAPIVGSLAIMDRLATPREPEKLRPATLRKHVSLSHCFL